MFHNHWLSLCAFSGDILVHSAMKPEAKGRPPKIVTPPLPHWNLSSAGSVQFGRLPAADKELVSELLDKDDAYSLKLEVLVNDCVYWLYGFDCNYHSGLGTGLLQLMLKRWLMGLMVVPELLHALTPLHVARPWLCGMQKTQHTPKPRGTSWRRWSILSLWTSSMPSRQVESCTLSWSIWAVSMTVQSHTSIVMLFIWEHFWSKGQ